MGSSLDLGRTVDIRSRDDEVVEVVVEAHPSWTKGWIARHTGIDEDKPGGLEREFLRADHEPTARSGNGSKIFLIQEPGVYEADSVWRSFKAHRTMFTVDGESRVEILGSTSEGLTPKRLREIAKEELRGARDKSQVEGEGGGGDRKR